MAYRRFRTTSNSTRDCPSRPGEAGNRSKALTSVLTALTNLLDHGAEDRTCSRCTLENGPATSGFRSQCETSIGVSDSKQIAASDLIDKDASGRPLRNALVLASKFLFGLIL